MSTPTRVLPSTIAIGVLYLLSSSAFASCSWPSVNGTSTNGKDNMTASLGIGRINIINKNLQPVGTTLATGVSNYSTILNGRLAASDDTDIVRCTQASDINSLSWAYATNGDSIIGGFYEIPGNPGFYATEFPYVAIKLTIADTGEVFSRFWKQSTIKVVTNDNGSGGFTIKKRDIPKVVATLIKWSEAYGSTTDANNVNVSGHHYCHPLGDSLRNEQHIGGSVGSNPDQVWTAGGGKYNAVLGGCNQPNGVLNIQGVSNNVSIGSDSNSSYPGYDYYIPIGLNGSPAATFTYAPSCVLTTVTPYVQFPVMTVSQLNAGDTVSQDFSVILSCDSNVGTTATTNSVAVALKASLPAYTNAQSLNLVDAEYGSVKYLVSDDYTSDGMAKGVGITLQNGEKDDVYFAGWNNLQCVTPTVVGTPSTGTTAINAYSYCPGFSNLSSMRRAGWDPMISGSTKISQDTETVSYSKTYTSTLTKIPNIAVTAGKIKATATVLVRYP